MSANSKLEWREVFRVEWERPTPPAPNGSSTGGTDYGVTILEQATWPQDGSQFAGITYEQRWDKQGPSPQYRDHVVIGHSDYPAPEQQQAALEQVAGSPLVQVPAPQLISVPAKDGGWMIVPVVLEP